MRCYDPTDDYDVKTLAELNAEPWMLEHLKLNPEYTCWGPGEDYMMIAKDETSAGWSSSQEIESWSAFGPWGLDTLNECVNFYFELARDAKKCEACEMGYSPQGQRFHDEWYGKASPPFDPIAYGVPALSIDHPEVQAFAQRNVDRHPEYYGRSKNAVRNEAARLHEMWAIMWMHHLNQADVDALAAAGRLWKLKEGPPPIADEVNAQYLIGMGHDAINQSVCIHARAEREGIAIQCATCHGSASIYTAPAAHMNLVVWMIHPRKGCSRGVRIQNLSREDAAAARAWLREAAKRNADRFAKLEAL